MDNKLIFLILLIPAMSLPLAWAGVTTLEISPSSPRQGEVVNLYITAKPEEGVEVMIIFSKTLDVVEGKYSWDLDDVYVPSTPNRVSVRGENVSNLHLSVQIIFWLTKSSVAVNGTASLSQRNVPKGTYNIKIHGDAANGTNTVMLVVTAGTTIKTGPMGTYNFSYNTGNIPLGNFTVITGALTRNVTLRERKSGETPELVIEDLNVSPPVSNIGDEIRISTTINNIGGQEDNYTLRFNLDGETLTETQIHMKVDEAISLNFSLPSLDEGLHSVSVGNLSRSFAVIPTEPGDTASKIFGLLQRLPVESATAILEKIAPESGKNYTAQKRVINITRAVEVIESAIDLGLEDEVSPLLLDLSRDENAQLPSTVARLFEEIDLDKVITVIRLWLENDNLKETGQVLDEASAQILDSVIETLTIEEQQQLLPYLSPESFNRINPEIMSLPDLRVENISAEELSPRRYLISVEIGNTGTYAPNKFNVTLTDDRIEVATTTLDPIKSGDVLITEFIWEPDTWGDHTIGAIVDGDNGVFERHELNNEGRLEVTVQRQPSKIGVSLILGLITLISVGALYKNNR